jgi:D-galactarolactone isomerase
MSGAYLNSKVGPPTYADATKVAQAFVRAAPERVVWGSDWPHPNLTVTQKPDDAVLLDLLSEWAPEETARHRILVENPQTLYGFTPLIRKSSRRTPSRWPTRSPPSAERAPADRFRWPR